MKRFCVSFILIFILSLVTVSAVGTHLNITLNEVVYRNTTFAKDFYLVENQTFCLINGTLNITNPMPEAVYDIYLQFGNTQKMIGNFTWVTTTKFGNQTSGTPGTDMVIHIPVLRQGNYSTFLYSLNCLNVTPPLNIETDYSNMDHGFNRKVLAGYNWTVNQKVINENYLKLNISNINISITADQVIWNTSSFNFSLEFLYGLGDYASVFGNGTSNKNWWWTPNGGEVEYNNSENITFRVKAPYSVPFTATYKAISEVVTYEVDFLLSNLSLKSINASSDINISFQKRIAQPAENEFSHNVTWEIRPEINTDLNITYDLNKVTLWVTQNMDINNKTGGTPWGLLEVNYTGNPMKEINVTTAWGNSSYYWFFNYTDGANASYPPPIVWIEPEWLISNKYGQIMNYSKTKSGSDTYVKYIYVINGYWLEVSKNITSIGEDMYQINIYVENIGNGWTPEFEYVTVYDFIPDDFAVWDMQPVAFACPTGSYCTNLSVGTPASSYYGMSFKWNIPWKGTLNSSLGPKSGPDATGPANYSWNVSYKVNGTGPYRVTDLYVVGLDPLRVDGASVSPVISVITGLQTYTKEIFYVGIVLFLIVVNITNLFITNKINKKLDGNTK